MYADRLLNDRVAPARGTLATNTFQMLLLAVLATCVPVFAHAAGGIAVGLPFAVGLALLIAGGAPAAMPVAIVFAFMFQNAAVALISPLITDQQSFNLARSYNFIIVATFWGVVLLNYFFGRTRLDRMTGLVFRYSLVVIGLIGVYLVIGAAQNANGAIIYLRNIAMPLMCLQIGLMVGARYRPEIVPAVTIIAVAAVLYGLAELIFGVRFLHLVNGDSYFLLVQQDQHDSGFWVREMKETGYVLRDLADPKPAILFNYFKDIPIKFHRLLGPNYHPVSFTYAICFFVILLIAARRGLIYLLFAVPVLIAAGSKGALVYMAMTVAALFVARRYRGPLLFPAFVLALAVYAVVAFSMALKQENYHALGFLGGITQFMANPFGHGLGAGGNLVTQIQDVDWSQAQQTGKTDEAVESAIAVLLYQMGIAAFAYIAFLGWLSWRCWLEFRRTARPLLAAAAFGVLALTVNGIFQEEAMFAPLALSLMTLLAGLELGQAAKIGAPPSNSNGARTGPRRPRLEARPGPPRLQLAASSSGS